MEQNRISWLLATFYILRLLDLPLPPFPLIFDDRPWTIDHRQSSMVTPEVFPILRVGYPSLFARVHAFISANQTIPEFALTKPQIVRQCVFAQQD